MLKIDWEFWSSAFKFSPKILRKLVEYTFDLTKKSLPKYACDSYLSKILLCMLTQARIKFKLVAKFVASTLWASPKLAIFARIAKTAYLNPWMVLSIKLFSNWDRGSNAVWNLSGVFAICKMISDSKIAPWILSAWAYSVIAILTWATSSFRIK